MHIAQNAGHTSQNEGWTMQNVSRTTRNVGHNTHNVYQRPKEGGLEEPSRDQGGPPTLLLKKNFSV